VTNSLGRRFSAWSRTDELRKWLTSDALPCAGPSKTGHGQSAAREAVTDRVRERSTHLDVGVAEDAQLVGRAQVPARAETGLGEREERRRRGEIAEAVCGRARETDEVGQPPIRRTQEDEEGTRTHSRRCNPARVKLPFQLHLL